MKGGEFGRNSSIQQFGQFEEIEEEDFKKT